MTYEEKCQRHLPNGLSFDECSWYVVGENEMLECDSPECVCLCV